MNPLSEEEQKEWQDRRTTFLEKYKALIDEYSCDFASFPMFMPNERGTFEVIINTEVVDKKRIPVKSPFIEGK